MGAAELAMRGPHHVIIARAKPRNTRYATRRLIDGLLDAAALVAKSHPGPKRAGGNMSYQKGGDIRWSVSHNSGRDADLAFYVIDATTKKPVTAPDLITFREDGVGKRGRYLFDVPRNWALAKALLTHDELQIQYLFISTGLKAMLLQHARGLEEPAWLLERASKVLHQPTDSSPHNDHLHVRVTCGLEERLVGCLNRGPRWDWVDWFEAELLATSVAMTEAMRSARVEDRVAALTYLREIRSPYAADVALWFGMRDASPQVRALSTSVAGAYWRWTLSALSGAQRAIEASTTTPRQRASLYAILRRSVDAEVLGFLRSRVANAPGRERALAARAMTHHMLAEHVPFLLERLRLETEGAPRAALAKVLRRITNHAEPLDWAKATEGQRERALAGWSVWWEENAGKPRDVWVSQGFKALGVEPESALEPGSVDALIAALPTAPDHQVYNINKTLRRVTGRWMSLEKSDGKKLHAFWSKWWKKNRARFGVG